MGTVECAERDASSVPAFHRANLDQKVAGQADGQCEIDSFTRALPAARKVHRSNA